MNVLKDSEQFLGINKLTKRELFKYQGVSDDFPEGSDNYYAMRAIEVCGSAIRDNTLNELIAIGKDIEENGIDRYI